MKKRSKTFLLVLLILFLALAAFGGTVVFFLPISATEPQNTAFEGIPGGTVLTAEEAFADANTLIAALERTHPAFSLREAPPEYDAAKQKFLEDAAQPKSVEEFSLLARAFLTSLRDGHTRVQSRLDSRYLDLTWQADGGRLFLYDGAALTQDEVVRIAGLPVAEVFAQVDRAYTAENAAALDKNHTRYAGAEALLALAGAELPSGEAAVEVRTARGTEARSIPFINGNPNAPTAARTALAEETSCSWKMIGDVFYVDMNACTVDYALHETADRLRQSVKNGVRKVILDVRGNGGGDSTADEILLDAMGMQAPNFGVYIRYSPLAKQQRGYRSDFWHWESAGGVKGARRNPEISLVVLTDADTFSSATMLAVFVQDGRLGTVVGQASSNSPNSYGDIVMAQLPNSGIVYSISHKKWFRPDAAADGTVVTPDIPVPYGEDILAAALDSLAA